MASEDNLKIIVVGAGIAGLTSAYLLRKAGHDVTVLEKNGNPRELDISVSPISFYISSTSTDKLVFLL